MIDSENAGCLEPRQDSEFQARFVMRQRVAHQKLRQDRLDRSLRFGKLRQKSLWRIED